MKRLYSILFLCLIPVLSNSQPQDSLNKVLLQQITELEKKYSQLENNQLAEFEEKISIIENRQSEIKSDRSYVNTTTVVIATIFTAVTFLLVVIVGLFVPRDLRRRVKRLEQNIPKETKKNKEYIDEKGREILGLSALAHRTMYSLSVERGNWMLVVWCGRWMRDLVKQYNYSQSTVLLRDMEQIMLGVIANYNNLSDENKSEIVRFRSLDEVKKNYQNLEAFEPSAIVRDCAARMLQIIYNLGSRENTTNTQTTTT